MKLPPSADCRRRFTFVNRHQFPIFKKQKNFMWSWQGSNLRPPQCKCGALPTELQPHEISLAVDQVGLRGLEPRTSSLSGMRSNHLSYKPKNKYLVWVIARIWVRPYPNLWLRFLLRKEVIQPHLPVRLPCYDLVLVTCLTLNSSLLAVRIPSLGTADFHDLTGGVYKTRERIHRSVLTYDY